MKRTKLRGTVVSTGMEKTVVVDVSNVFRHPRYKKVLRKNKRFKAHDTLGVSIGTQVEIEECRPMSKEKKFRVLRVIGKDGERK